MDLQSQLTALKTQSSSLTLPERAELSCALARQLERAGEYDAAREALDEFWPERDETPKISGLSALEQADVLLRIGALAGWLGGTDQTIGSQERAKDLITRSIEIFEEFERPNRIAEARSELGLCYWREGSFGEARINLASALDSVHEDDDLKARVLIRLGMVELRSGRLNEAFRFHNLAGVLVDSSNDPALKGTFHNQLATIYEHLRTNKSHDDYTDRALMEYTAASVHFEQAGNERYLARVENNLGYLFFTIGKYSDAHGHLNRARHLFLKLKDRGTAAQVDDTRARTLLAEGHVAEAERLARSAVRVLERGDQQALLAEALTTEGVALARLGNRPRARVLLERAIEVAETTGDLDGAGRARLSIIEEFAERISVKELVSIYRSAVENLKDSQDPATGKRLIMCAKKLLETLARLEIDDQESKEHNWEGFSLRKHVREDERAVIERALRDAGGSVTRAAHLLGFKHHQSLISLINSRHTDLLQTRSPVRKRRRHLFSQPRKLKKKVVIASPRPTTSQLLVLHVEDNKAVSSLVQDTLATEGMHADTCLNGMTALEILKSDSPYDVIIVDNDLPGLSGLELVLRVRSMAHRRGTPIIMLSGDDCEKEAWRAGVGAFLWKPEGVDKLASTVTRLLEERKSKKE